MLKVFASLECSKKCYKSLARLLYNFLPNQKHIHYSRSKALVAMQQASTSSPFMKVHSLLMVAYLGRCKH